MEARASNVMATVIRVFPSRELSPAIAMPFMIVPPDTRSSKDGLACLLPIREEPGDPGIRQRMTGKLAHDPRRYGRDIRARQRCLRHLVRSSDRCG
jgi:hypothetical protein